MNGSKTRVAEKAGSWYTKEAPKLKNELNSWLQSAIESCNQEGGVLSPTVLDARTGAPVRLGAWTGAPDKHVKAIISPHAGYMYSGATAAFGFCQIDPREIDRVFILGPSHYMYLENCALTGHQYYATPFGDLQIDTKTVSELKSTGHFGVMSEKVDSDEHSIEMQLPFLAHVLKKGGAGNLERVKVVPILVGALKKDRERFYGELLAPYLLKPRTLFIISSDFCHWGERFSYRPPAPWPQTLELYKAIRDLDRQGMGHIERIDFKGFVKYIEHTKNTICGRHPIAVLLAAVDDIKDKHLNKNTNYDVQLRFLHYAQSNRVTKASDSSVSYASAKLTFTSTA